MGIILPPLPGLSSAVVKSIPETWSASWFRGLVNNVLKNGDVRNAISGPNISVTGNITSQATIGLAAGYGTAGQILTSNGSNKAASWQNAPTSGITVTDGTHTVTGTTQVTFSGATVGGATPDATVTISGSSTALPGTINDLQLWIETDDILASNGSTVSTLGDRTPWLGGTRCYVSADAAVTLTAATLNALNAITWAAGGGYFTLPTPFYQFNGSTIFVVFKLSSTAGTQALVGGATGSTALYGTNSGGGKLVLVDSGHAVLATDTTALSTGTWYQANATYNPSTGAYAFRVARAASSSGTAATGSGTGVTEYVGGDEATNTLAGASLAVLIVYNAVLSSAQISSVENYLHSKWGV
jgi:hypothetical protein